MKIYLIRGIFESYGEHDDICEAYATRELAEEKIKLLIADEINTQIDNGIIERKDDGEIKFCNDNGIDDEYIVEISPTHLYLADNCGFMDEFYIDEKELITEAN